MNFATSCLLVESENSSTFVFACHQSVILSEFVAVSSHLLSTAVHWIGSVVGQKRRFCSSLAPSLKTLSCHRKKSVQILLKCVWSFIPLLSQFQSNSSMNFVVVFTQLRSLILTWFRFTWTHLIRRELKSTQTETDLLMVLQLLKIRISQLLSLK